MIFEIATKLEIAFVGLILGGVWVDGFNGQPWETDMRYEFDSEFL